MTHKKAFLALAVLVLLVSVAQTGCWRTGENMNPLAPEGGAPSSGTNSANVGFNIVFPGQNLLPFPTPSILADAASAAFVTFQLKLVNFGNPTIPFTVLTKTVPVANGLASTTFQGLPVSTLVGKIHIENGKIGSFTDFHGALDLTPGNNRVDLAPVGSLMPQDVVANVIEQILASSSLIASAPTGLAVEITRIVSALPLTGNEVYQDSLNNFKNRNGLPTVRLTKPTDAQVFVVGKLVEIVASASDPDGVVAKVEFFQGSSKIGEAAPPVLSMAWDPGQAGDFKVSARVTDNTSAVGVSSWVAISVVPDTSRPIVAISTLASSTTNVSPILVKFVFSEPVTGFTLSDIQVTNGSASNLQQDVTDPKIWTVEITPATVGNISVSIPENAVQDDVNNGNPTSAVLEVVYDNVRPTVTLTSAASNPTSLSPIPVKVTFGKVITGFTLSDIQVTNGSAGNLQQDVTDPKIWSVVITPAAVGNVSVSIPENAVQDGARNGNPASTVLGVVYDNVRPAVTLTSIASNPTSISPIPVKATFTKVITDFTLSDIKVTNGTAGNLQRDVTDPKIWTVEITPATVGNISVSIPENAVQDDAKNGNPPSTPLGVFYDNVGPSVTLMSTASNPTNLSPIPVKVTFTKLVTGFDSSDVQVTNGFPSDLQQDLADQKVWAVKIIPSGQGIVAVTIPDNSVQDSAGNKNSTPATFSIAFDNIRPTVTLTTSASNPTNIFPIPVKITFSEPVTPFNRIVLQTVNCSISDFYQDTVDPKIWAVSVLPLADGALSITVPDNAIFDAAGCAAERNGLTTVHDKTPPLPSMSIVSSAPYSIVPLLFKATFSEAVSGFSPEGVQIENGSVSSFTQISGEPNSWLIKVNPVDTGPVVVAIKPFSVLDYSDNKNIASSSCSLIHERSLAGILSDGSIIAKGYYFQSADLQVASGAHVSVEPGTKIRGNGFEIRSAGTINCLATSPERIIFQDARISGVYFGDAGNRSNQVVFNFQNCDFQSGKQIFNYAEGAPTSAFFARNCTFNQVNSLESVFWEIDRGVIASCSFSGCRFSIRIIPVGDITFADNRFTSSPVSFEIRRASGFLDPKTNVSIVRNVFSGTKSIVVNSVDTTVLNPPIPNVDISNNLFFSWDWAAIIFNLHPFLTMRKNTFLSTSLVAVRFQESTVSTFNLSENYWNTQDPSAIDSMIVDKNDSISWGGSVTYTPFLTTPDPLTPNL